jgi:hypothetical protein
MLQDAWQKGCFRKIQDEGVKELFDEGIAILKEQLPNGENGIRPGKDLEV